MELARHASLVLNTVKQHINGIRFLSYPVFSATLRASDQARQFNKSTFLIKLPRACPNIKTDE